MLTLGIETSGRAGAIAVCRSGQILASRSLEQVGRRHAQTLVAESVSLLRECCLTLRDCQAVAVSIGPGSFTGLRVGVVFAKTLAYAAGCQVAAVDTLAAIAENSPSDVSVVDVVVDAERSELYAARYGRDASGQFVREGALVTVSREAWCAAVSEGVAVSGPGLEGTAESVPTFCRVLSSDCWQPRASVVAVLGERQLAASRADDLWTLEPLYVRKSAAEEKADVLGRSG
jgi:tRNA threonylcarbamoyladenosine biosynthesis protein TsaB